MTTPDTLTTTAAVYDAPVVDLSSLPCEIATATIYGLDRLGRACDFRIYALDWNHEPCICGRNN